MDERIKQPTKWNHKPLYKRILLIATIIVAFLFLLIALLPTPKVQAVLRGITLDESEQRHAGDYLLAYLPQGYEITKVKEWYGFYNVEITAPDQPIIRFSSKSKAGSRPNIDAEHIVMQMGTVNGYEAFFFTGQEEGWSNHVIWYVGEDILSLESLIPTEELRLIAEYCRIIED